MVIDLNMVIEGLAEVIAAHGRSSINKNDVAKLWFKELERLDYKAFLHVIDTLKFSEQFPNLATVRSCATSARFAGRSTAVEGKKGCEYCKGGYVHFRKGGYEYAGACIHCKTAPKGIPWVDPRKCAELVGKHGDNEPYRLSLAEQKAILKDIAEMVEKKSISHKADETLRSRRLKRDQMRDFEPTEDDAR